MCNRVLGLGRKKRVTHFFRATRGVWPASSADEVLDTKAAGNRGGGVFAHLDQEE